MLANFFYSLLLVLLLAGQIALASITKPLTDYGDLDEPVEEAVVQVLTAKVVMADYPLLRKDFVVLADKQDSEIDQWVLEYGAMLSANQSEKGEVAGVNSKISSRSVSDRKAFRPAGYGRALVLQVPGEGYVDAKGAGALEPKEGSHSNGLATLGEAIQEYFTEKLVQKVLAHAGSSFLTIGTYAVVDWGFQVKDPNEGWVPAGLVLRQAHRRLNCGMDYRDPTSGKVDFGDSIEKVLRKYGLSSAGENFMQDQETNRYMNIQRSREGAIVDFGTYLVLKDFTQPLWWYNRGHVSSMPKTVQIWDTSSEEFVHPEPGLQVSVKFWGVEKIEGEWVDHLWNQSQDWAKQVHNDSARRVEMDSVFAKAFASLDSKWQRNAIEKMRLKDAAAEGDVHAGTKRRREALLVDKTG